MSPKLIFTKITDIIFLTYELIIGNRRLIFPTMIGLIIALTVISQSGVLIESYRQEIFDETVFENQNYYYRYQGDVTVELYSWDLRTRGSDIFTDFRYYSELVDKSITQVNFSDYVSYYYWYSSVGINVWLNRTEYDYQENAEGMVDWGIDIYTSSSLDFFNQLELILETTGKGRLPENSSELLFIRPRGEATVSRIQEREEKFENLTLGTEVNITHQSDVGTRLNKTVRIVGIVEYERTDYYYYYDDYIYSSSNSIESDNTSNLVWNYLRRFSNDYIFLTSPSLLNITINDLSENNLNVDMYGDIRGKIFLDKTHFNAYNFNDEMKKLQKFLQALELQFYPLTYSPRVDSRILDAMYQFQYTIFGLIIIMLLVSFPVISIALYLVVYSFGLIRKQKQEQIGIIKTRGGSWFQVLMILLGEMFISTIFAVMVGFILSVFLADVVMRSTDYLEFLGFPFPIQVSFNMVQDLIFWGLFLALLLNFRKIIRMSRLRITESLVPTETRDPVWKRYYLDIVMFVIGTATWIIFMNLLSSSSSGDEIEPIFYIIYPLISLLGLPAPFLMFFGTILVIARFFPILIKKLSEVFWKLEGGINAFAIRNIVRHKQAANRAVLLITLALSFSILSSSLIFSLDETERLENYYNVGADLSLSTGSSLNESILNLLDHNVSHLSSISGVYSARYESYGGYLSRRYNFLFVNASTYAKTAFNDQRFKLSSSLTNLMSQIANNETIILFEGNLKEDVSKPKVGGNLSLHFTNTSHSEVLPYRIAGTFKYWPTLYPYEWYDHSRYYWIIGNLGMFERLNKSAYLNSPLASYQAKIDSLTNIEETVETVYNVTNIQPSAPALKYKEYKTDFNRKFILSILNSDLIICIAISVIGVIMFAFFTYVERGKEIGVERALGMTRLQTAQSFLVEAAMILTFGIIIGYLTGSYFVTMFLQITQFGQTIPPLVVSYPMTLLGQMLLSILVVAGIGTIIPAYLATRKDISRILKVE